MRHVWRLTVVMAAIAVVAAGCGKKASDKASEKAIESAMKAGGQDAEVSVNSDTMQIKTKDGDMSIGAGAKLPDNWPDDVPVYKGLKLLSTMKSKESFSVQGTSTDSQEKVAAFYKEQAVKHGWTEETVMTQPQMAMMSYSKEKRSLSVTVSGQDSETSVSIIIGNQ